MTNRYEINSEDNRRILMLSNLKSVDSLRSIYYLTGWDAARSGDYYATVRGLVSEPVVNVWNLVSAK